MELSPGDKLINTMQQLAVGRYPGWDRQVASALTDYAIERFTGQQVGTPTDALILQVEKWIEAEEKLAKIEELVNGR